MFAPTPAQENDIFSLPFVNLIDVVIFPDTSNFIFTKDGNI